MPLKRLSFQQLSIIETNDFRDADFTTLLMNEGNVTKAAKSRAVTLRDAAARWKCKFIDSTITSPPPGDSHEVDPRKAGRHEGRVGQARCDRCRRNGPTWL